MQMISQIHERNAGLKEGTVASVSAAEKNEACGSLASWVPFLYSSCSQEPCICTMAKLFIVSLQHGILQPGTKNECSSRQEPKRSVVIIFFF